jgi:hypothetical protein
VAALGSAPFPDDEYRQTTRASATEIASDPIDAVERLTEDLLAVVNRGRFGFRA